MRLTRQKIRAAGTRDLRAEILLVICGRIERIRVRRHHVRFPDEDIPEGGGSGGVGTALEEAAVATFGGCDGEVGCGC